MHSSAHAAHPTTSPDLVPVRRALLSVSDKDGLVAFARSLAALDVELVSTGGTAKALRDAGLRVLDVADLTGAPEMMDGRVKTLHPKVHGGLLSVRDNPEHAAAMRKHAIGAIDLLCVNLYPFERTVARPGCTRAEAIENIDIGGPAMIRSGAKNHAYVTVVTDAAQYARVLADLAANRGATTRKLREDLALAAFARTSAYDAAIAAYLRSQGSVQAGGQPNDQGARDAGGDWPARLTLAYERAQTLRYGENPHQRAAVYRDAGPEGAAGVLSARQLHGKELSYNNVADAAAAWELALALHPASADHTTGACVMKHANPCGAATAPSALQAIDRALAGDPVAAFGGILACSGTVDAPSATRLATKGTFLEVIIAPAFSDDALAILKARSEGLRLLAVGGPGERGTTLRQVRSIRGGLLVQEGDTLPPDPASWRHVAGPAPDAPALRAAASLEIMVRAMHSNAIALGQATNGGAMLVGGGVGQVDRVTACRLAIEKAGARAAGAIAVSDAFFPFPDGPQVLIDAGVKTIVHPGGSKRDQETTDLCAKHAVTCMLTGVRRFRH